MNIVNEMSSVLTEVESLRSEVKVLREAKIVADFELDQLRRRNAQLLERIEIRVGREMRLKTILDQAGQSLVSGINQYNAEERTREQPELIGSEAPRYLNGPAESNAA